MTATSKLKIVHVVNLFIGGAVPHILRDIYPHLRDKYTFEVITLEGADASARVAYDFVDLGIPVIAPDRPLGVVGQYRFLKSQLLKSEAGIVHAHMGRSMIMAPLCHPRDTKIALTYHTVRSGFNPLTRLALDQISPNIDGCTYVSEEVAQTWLGARPLLTQVVPNPIDMERYTSAQDAESVRRELGISPGTIMLLSVGRLIASKGHSVLLHALSILIRSMPTDFVLVLAGRGPLENQLRQLVQKLDLADRVLFLGFREDIPSLTAAADIAVLPSFWEGFGLAAAEAMAGGKPVIASDLPSTRAYISDGVSGLTFAKGDAEALADKIRVLVGDKHLRDRLGITGRETIARKFSAPHIAASYAEFYDRLVYSEVRQ